jgi:hypothetical protein
MKLNRKLILAGMLVAGTAWAQSEQWLEYHTANEGRAYIPLKLTTNAPLGVALPELNTVNGVPYFARWSTPMDPSGGRWLCLDRTHKSGPYDRLFIDSKGNGRLDDETPVLGRVDSNNGMFPATPVVFTGGDGPITYHLAFRFSQYDRGSAQLLASSAGWYEGTVNFDGVKKRILLIDGNVNGTFNDMSSDPYKSDRIQFEGDKAGERFLGRMLEVDGKFFNVQADRDGAFIKVQKAENVALGPVRVPENIASCSVYGTNGHFVRQPVNGEFTVPTGCYRMIRWEIQRKDEKGVAWTLSGYNFPQSSEFEVAAGKLFKLDIGEPVKADLSTETRGQQIAFNLKFVGKQNEAIEMMRDNQRPRGPKLMLANADGSLCYTNSFEFG